MAESPVENLIEGKKTTITVPRTLLVRLQGLMRYGDTYGGKINELIDFYERVRPSDKKST